MDTRFCVVESQGYVGIETLHDLDGAVNIIIHERAVNIADAEASASIVSERVGVQVSRVREAEEARRYWQLTGAL